MQIYQRAILTHGGAGSDMKDADGTQSAALGAMNLMKDGLSALDAAVYAVRYLEDDPRFNAGNGSLVRVDGHTIQLDASCMTSDGKFGAVACVEEIQNPIDLAKGVLNLSPHVLIVGEGAKNFGIENGIPLIPLSTPSHKMPGKGGVTSSCDTVGAVVFDGVMFAAALSSGGIAKSALGRVGDVPLPGCGLFCGSIGAVACTGNGDLIALKILAKEVYTWLEQKMSPAKAVQKALSLFDKSIDIGLIVLTKTEFAANSQNGMAWSHLRD